MISDGVPDAGPTSASSTAAPTLVCEEVVHTYARSDRMGGEGAPSVTALEEVSLTVEAGELTVVAGASGSGKTTLLHLLGALEPPTEGRVLLDGTDVGSLSERQRAALRLERVGIIFQRFHLLPALSARANVGVPLIERGVPRARRRDRAADLLERVGLGDRLTHRPGELSGGEQQRVAIARALVGDPDFLIADEPTGELDTETGGTILDVLHELASDRAVVVATHDEHVIAEADRVIELQDGRVLTDDR